MIYVDSRAGSADLVGSIQAVSPRTPTLLTTLDYGDAWFGGYSPQGMVRFGFELKKVQDALQCMQTGRLTGQSINPDRQTQLPGMWQDYDHVTLIIEGELARDPGTGTMMQFTHGRWRHITIAGRYWDWQNWENWLNVMLLTYPGLMIKYTLDGPATARYLVGMYDHLQQPWEAHCTSKIIYQPQPTSVEFRKPSLLRFTASGIKGIGWEKSQAVEARFRSVQEMANTDVDGWLRPKIDGIGRTIAARAVGLLKGVKG